MVNKFSSLLIFGLITTIFNSCTYNDESLINNLEARSRLSIAQYQFFEGKRVEDIQIDEKEILTGLMQFNDETSIYFFKTDVTFENIETVLLPGARFENKLIYRKKDTLVNLVQTLNGSQLYKSVNMSPFQLIKDISVPNDNEKYFISSFAMQNSNLGYYIQYRHTNIYPSEAKLFKIENGNFLELKSTIGANASINVSPSGTLIYSQYFNSSSNNYNIAVSKSSDNGFSWTFPDTIKDNTINRGDIAYRQNNMLVVEDNFYTSCLSGSSSCYYSADAVEWSLIYLQNQKINNIQFFNKLDGFLATGGDGFGGDLYKTYDGGNSWFKVNYEEEFVLNFYFTNRNVGVYTGSSVMKITRDGGATWEIIAHYTGGLFNNP